jgi:predicted transcriptional regulator
MKPRVSRIEGMVNTAKNDPYLTTKIVRSYVRQHRVRPEQLSDLITSVHQALGRLGQPVQLEEVRTPAVSVRRSVHRDYVVCLDCGYQGKTLRRHIATRHGLDADQYRQRWGLRSDHPITAPAYSERRSALAKSLGLGRRSMSEVVGAETPIAAPPPADATANSNARRTRRSRPASKSEGTESEAALPMPVRKRRSRARVASPSA